MDQLMRRAFPMNRERDGEDKKSAERYGEYS